MNQLLADRYETLEYTSQYSGDFVSKWDELINWDLRKKR